MSIALYRIVVKVPVRDTCNFATHDVDKTGWIVRDPGGLVTNETHVWQRVYVVRATSLEDAKACAYADACTLWHALQTQYAELESLLASTGVRIGTLQGEAFAFPKDRLRKVQARLNWPADHALDMLLREDAPPTNCVYSTIAAMTNITRASFGFDPQMTISGGYNTDMLSTIVEPPDFAPNVYGQVMDLNTDMYVSDIFSRVSWPSAQMRGSNTHDLAAYNHPLPWSSHDVVQGAGAVKRMQYPDVSIDCKRARKLKGVGSRLSGKKYACSVVGTQAAELRKKTGVWPRKGNSALPHHLAHVASDQQKRSARNTKVTYENRCLYLTGLLHSAYVGVPVEYWGDSVKEHEFVRETLSHTYLKRVREVASHVAPRVITGRERGGFLGGLHARLSSYDGRLRETNPTRRAAGLTDLARTHISTSPELTSLDVMPLDDAYGVLSCTSFCLVRRTKKESTC